MSNATKLYLKWQHLTVYMCYFQSLILCFYLFDAHDIHMDYKLRSYSSSWWS